MTEDVIRKNICSELARLLREERVKKKLSLNEISRLAGLNRQTVSFIEQEKRTPTIETLLRVTQVLGTPLEQVIKKARKNVRLNG